MSDHFHITVDVSELGNAMTKFGWLAEQLGTGGEGGKLAGLTGSSGSWTGQAATACLGEMGTIATTMTGAAPKFTVAHDAVQTFQTVVETAQNDTLPKLNTNWAESVTAYNTAVGKADKTLADYASTADGSQSANAGEHAQETHDTAVHDASVTQAGAQKSINGDYDSMITTLKTAAKACGDALAAAVVITFTAEQWATVKGGGPIPLGLKFQLRAEAFGPDTLLHHSDGLVVGDYVGKKLNKEAGGVPGDLVDPEVLALMKQFGGDKAFVEGMMTTVGPAGMAYLGYKARILYESGGDDTKQGQQLLNTLTTIYGTGSYVTVPAADGSSSKPLMDQDWLDHFNPAEYSSLSDSGKGFFATTAWVKGYRPDLLLPFLDKQGIVSPSVSQLVAQQALTDYEKAKNLDDLAAGQHWALYCGDDGPMGNGQMGQRNVLMGNKDNPFRTELFHIALDRASDYASVSNTIMLTHTDTMLDLMTGSAPWLTGSTDGSAGYDWGSAGLAKILQQATINYDNSNPVTADGALWVVADYLNKHGDKHLVNNVQLALGTVITDPRMFNGAVSSVTGPDFTGGKGYLDDPNQPGAGPLMSPELWARLHQEGMLQPTTAATLIKEFGQYINGTSDGAQHLGYTWDPEKRELVQNTQVTSLSLYQAEAARNFLGKNLLVDHDALVKALEKELEQNNQNKEQAKAVVGQLVDWATDPTSITASVATKLTDFTIDKVVDGVFPSDADIQKKYDGSIASLQSNLDNAIVKPGFWDDVNQTANQMVKDISSGAGPTDTDSVTPGYLTPEEHKTYTGDPTQYVGKQSSYVGDGQVINDDFLTYDKTTGKPDGVVPIGQMNSLQRQAYQNWLHDPAVQAYLEGKNDAIAKAREQAGR